MALLDVGPRNDSLDMSYGADKGALAAASHLLALFDEDPSNGGVEVSGGGYARVTVTNDVTNWPAASGGAKTGAEQAFPVSTGAWDRTAKWWCLIDAADGTTRWDARPLDVEVSVTGAGVVVKVRPVIDYEDVI